MGVYVRPDSSFFWLRLNGWRDERGHQLREPTMIRVDAPTPEQRKRNRDLAEQAFHARMTELAREDLEPERKPAITFDDFADWWEAHKLPRRKGRSREAGILRVLRAAFGHHDLPDVNPTVVAEWRTERLATPTKVTQHGKTRLVYAGPGTVNREEGLLKSILQAAVPKYLKQSPLYGMKKLRTEAVRRRNLTEAEEDRLLAMLEPRDRPIVIMGLDDLCRLSDILNLRRDDDFRRYLYIRDPKNPRQSTGYTVPVSKRLRKALDALPMAGPYYFAHRRRAKNPEHWRSGIRSMIESACRRATPKIPYGRKHGGITFHWATRRTGASRMLAGGEAVNTVQRLGNWAGPQIVLGIYGEVVDANVQRAVEIPGHRKKKAGGRR